MILEEQTKFYGWVGKVREVREIEAVNRLLDEGWVILKVENVPQRTRPPAKGGGNNMVYIMGKEKSSATVDWLNVKIRVKISEIRRVVNPAFFKKKIVNPAFFKKNLGVPLLLAFQALLLGSGGLYVIGRGELGIQLSVYAFYALLGGITMQMFSYVRYDKRIEDDLDGG